MDIRELKLWITEARIKKIFDKAERYAASVLPERGQEEINKEFKRMEYEFYEIEHEDEIDAAEEDVKKHMEKRRK